jgi:histidinol-phosphate aminotransferase
MAAYKAIASELHRYPEGGSIDLRAAIGRHHGLDPERIVCGTGSDELLNLLVRAYCGPGDELLYSQHGFLMYPINAKGVGATPVAAPETPELRTDIEALLKRVTDKTRIVVLANPNNPTGTYLSDAEVRRLHAGLRPDILLVIDSAYAEYVTAADYSVGLDLVGEADNVVMVRTFSKMGLAAARIGWMVGPPHVVDAINRIRGPFNVNLPAQLAGAAATREVEFNARLKAHNAKWRDWLTAELHSNSMRVVPSQANFIMVLFPDADFAARAFETLRERGLIVREIGPSYGIPEGLRISIGSEQAMRSVAGILKALVKIS